MMMSENSRPQFSDEECQTIIEKAYGRFGTLSPLPSERDQNFLLTTKENEKFVFKITGLTESVDILLMQNLAMQHVNRYFGAGLTPCPEVITAVSGQTISTATKNGQDYPVRLITYLPGELYADVPQDAHLHRRFGQFLGKLDETLATFEHPAAHRTFRWDLTQASFISDYTQYIQDENGRKLVENFLHQFQTITKPQLTSLRQQVIHNDANDYNLLVGEQLAIIDFGDMVYAPTICELAIGIAYAILGQPDPVLTAAQIVAGYHETYPLYEDEIALLFNLIAMRLCVSVTIASHNQTREPDNAYLQISAKPAWDALQKLANTDPNFAHAAFRHACQYSVFSFQFSAASNQPSAISQSPISSPQVTNLQPLILNSPAPNPQPPIPNLLDKRSQILNPSLSISYNKPLKIVRGYMQYLYDENGRSYLDAVNNVPHVGHCHPHVVQAGQRQMAILNTNTRYLHDTIVAYAERLAAKFPDPLNVVYFVNSGSEANELALRLAHTITGRKDMLVLDAAYHGNTGNLVDLSPYKFDGRGGQGKPDHVHVLPMPDPYRGEFKGYGRSTGQQYAQAVQTIVDDLMAKGTPPAAFIEETLLGCGGQIVMPDGYLEEAYKIVREAGGLCIADEVQIGFGRVGTHFWGFETQGVIADIVTMGKPIGNGHPLAAVITTREIADAFNNGMEYFNTFGGNPVSCAIGTAVLAVIEQENLQQNALNVGNHLMAGLRRLQEKYDLIGDVRGLGLYIGAELVRDRQTLEPADTEASAITNAMKENGILISTDGPYHNVLKIKPPIIFTQENADQLVSTLDNILAKRDTGHSFTIHN